MEMVLPSCLNVFVILEGGIDFKLDEIPFAFSALKENSQVQPTAFAVAITKPARLERHSRRGSRTRKVNIMIKPEWLDDCGLNDKADAEDVGCFLRKHLAQTSWEPSSRAVALAEQMLNPPRLPPIVRELYLESRAIELAAEALQALNGELRCPALDRAGTIDICRAQTVRDYIEQRLGDPLTLSIIAREVGIGTTTLQRLFKSVYGTTVVEYVRIRKLERARFAIETEGLSVSEAAYLAGYRNPANFATAFKRAFGISPKMLRN
ncbi:MAG: AraC family transcriptional regulator [Hyphomicrobiaceae bacterium]|nr:AraC family transcriptional regulator [Hyphomicrobiaceae bacterium]